MIKNGHIYKARMIVEVKPEKYRITLKSLAIKGYDPQACIERNGKYFNKGRLELLMDLNGKLMDTFDFKKYSPTNPTLKDW